MHKYLQHLQIKNTTFNKKKITIIKRVDNLVKRVFPKEKVSTQVYGSQATGLALPESDVDLQIKGFGRNNNRQESEDRLKELFEVLAGQPWIKASS